MNADNVGHSKANPTELDSYSEVIDTLSLEESAGGEEARIILERAHWFGKRAGSLPDSTSSTRYLNAVDSAIITPIDPRETISESLFETFAAALKQGKQEALLLDAQAGLITPDQNTPAPRRIPHGIGPVFYVKSVSPPYSLLAMILNPEEAPGLDPSTAAFAHWRQSDEEETLVEATRYFAKDNMLIGRATEPGFYQAVALPSHSFTDSLFKVTSSIWSECRFHYLTTGLDRASDMSDAVQQAGTRLPGLADGNEIVSILEPLIKWLSQAAGKNLRTLPEPPVLKLWRLLKMRVDPWSAIGPVAGDRVNMIGRVTQIDTHPGNGDTVIAASAGGGVWRTDNAGKYWRPLMESEPTLTMGAVAFAPSNPGFIYAASGEDAGPWNPAWPGGGVYRSEDGGASWTLTSKTSSTRFSAIVVDSHDPKVFYVAGNKGLHKSTDGGYSWINNPGLLSLFDGHVTDVVLGFDDTDKKTVFIGVHNLGILRSLTGGQSLKGAPAFTLIDRAPLPTGADAGWIKLAVGRNGEHGSNLIIAKLGQDGKDILVTVDGGNTWEKRKDVAKTDCVEWTSVIAVNPLNDCLLFAGAALETLNVSKDQGRSWVDLDFGPQDQQDIAFDNQDAQRMYLANDTGVYLSTDGGQSWSLASEGMSISQVYDLDISEQDEKVVACGTQDTGLYYRDNSGVWKSFVASDVTQVAIDPTVSKILYSVGPANEGTIILKCLSPGPTRTTSVNLGERGPWVPILKLHPFTNIENPAANRKMFLCGSHTFYHSSDAGQCFQRVEYNLSGPFITDGEITALEYAPGDPSFLYLGTSNGVLYKASRGGLIAEDWTRTKADFPRSPISSIGIDWRNSDYVWVVLAGNGVSRLSRPEGNDQSSDRIHVVRTSDGGSTWVNASGRIMNMRLPDVPMSAIALDPFDRNVAYVGTDVGVFRTSDGGVSWLAFQDGLPRSPVTELRLNRRKRILFAATMGRGVYRRSLD